MTNRAPEDNEINNKEEAEEEEEEEAAKEDKEDEEKKDTHQACPARGDMAARLVG
jgi:hypothetical protein